MSAQGFSFEDDSLESGVGIGNIADTAPFGEALEAPVSAEIPLDDAQGLIDAESPAERATAADSARLEEVAAADWHENLYELVEARLEAELEEKRIASEEAGEMSLEQAMRPQRLREEAEALEAKQEVKRELIYDLTNTRQAPREYDTAYLISKPFARKSGITATVITAILTLCTLFAVVIIVNIFVLNSESGEGAEPTPQPSFAIDLGALEGKAAADIDGK